VLQTKNLRHNVVRINELKLLLKKIQKKINYAQRMTKLILTNLEWKHKTREPRPKKLLNNLHKVKHIIEVYVFCASTVANGIFAAKRRLSK
jgi:hypothetical protein